MSTVEADPLVNRTPMSAERREYDVPAAGAVNRTGSGNVTVDRGAESSSPPRCKANTISVPGFVTPSSRAL